MNSASFFALMAIVAVTVFSPVFGDESSFLEHSNSWEKDPYGCELEGKQFPVGKMLAMNRKDIVKHQINGGYVSDGEAVMMICTYLVDPISSDHPKVGERDYRWAAFSWVQ